MDEPRHRIIRRKDVTRRQLRAVPAADPALPDESSMPSSIGRLIAQTALIADSALHRRRREQRDEPRRRGRFGWFL
jgi:hypothetical protein